jgi:hypothetical protein
MTNCSESMIARNLAQSPHRVKTYRGDAIMKSALCGMLAVLALVGVSAAKELPNAPSASMPTAGYYYVPSTPATREAPKQVEKRPVLDAKFAALAVISTGSTFADSYTTLFARENWLAGKTGVCNMEVESAYLYGTHPTVGRTYAVATVKSATAVLAAYTLRKHHSRLWSLPLIGNSLISLQGVTQNMINCN